MAENHVTLTLELPGDADDYVVSVRGRMPDDAVGRRGLRLFVSHASEDQEVAAQLVQSLEMFGVECFFSERSISSGTLWPAEIETQLNACDALLYLSSEHSNDSMWCQQEAAWALGRGVPVLPLPLDRSEMRGALALRNQLPKPDLDSWVPADKELGSFRRAQRARARTVGEIFKGLMRLDERVSEVIPGLVVNTLVRADKQHKVLCAKDMLKLMPSITDEQATDVLRACEDNETLAGLANMGVVEELRELVEQKRAL